MQTHYTAAFSGLGAALLPRFIGDNDARLMRVQTGMLETGQELWLMYHRDLKGSGRVLAMRDFVRDLCQRELAKYV